MKYPIEINTMADYNNVSAIGFNPLIDWKRFKIDYGLRLQLQHELFGKTILGYGDIPQVNQKFYEYCWKNSLVHVCEECMHPLYDYKAIYISHILSRGGYPELAHDLRNFNLLCPLCHHQWESEYSGMKIRKKNKIVIKLMIADSNNMV